MQATIVVEKPYMAQRLAPFVQPLFPRDTQLSFVVVWPIGLLRQPFPRGMGWRDFPAIEPFGVDRFTPRTDRFSSTWVLNLSPESVWEKHDDPAPWPLARKALTGADATVVVWDPNSSLYHADSFLRHATGRGLQPGQARLIHSFNADHLKTVLQGEDGVDRQAQSWVSYGRVRHYFDHQFGLNSAAVLGRTLGNEVGVVSKYSLQLLMAARDGVERTESQWIQTMAHWQGTGRYAPEEGIALGSPMSWAAILEHVVNNGWLVPIPGRRPVTLALGPKGHAALARLHPGCEDADLPFRLHDWAQQGLEASQPAIDRYIRTFFGRQKRFLDRLESVRSYSV